MSNIVDIMNATRKAAEELHEDPSLKITGIDIEIAFLRAHIAIAHQKIGELLDERRKIEDSIRK